MGLHIHGRPPRVCRKAATRMASPGAHGGTHPRPCQNYRNDDKTAQPSLWDAHPVLVQTLPEHGGLFPPEHLCPREPCTRRHPVRLHSPDPLRRATDTPRAALAEQGEDSPADPSSLLHRRPTKCSHQSDLWSQRCPPHCTTSTTGHTAWTAPPLHTCSLEPFPSICPGQTPRKLFTLSKWCDPLSVPQGNVPWDTPKPGQLSAPREQTRADLPANQSIRLKRTCLC